MSSEQNPKIDIFLAEGYQNDFFTKDPEVNFFNTVYNQYFNFSMELIDIMPIQDNTKLKVVDKPLFLRFDIPRNGDLINNMYLQVTLPDIYSFKNIAGDINPSEIAREFQWIRRLGEYLVEDASFFVGETRINKLYSEWLHIWNELNLSSEKKEGYNRMIGNINEMNDPKTFGGGTYPGSGEFISGSATEFVPTIRGRDLLIPLPFWFTQNTSLALPLISLQYELCRVELNLRAFNQLFTIIDNNSTNADTTDDIRIKPSKEEHNFSKYLDINKPVQLEYTTTVINELEINPKLKVNYVFLDNQERTKMSKIEQNYLITEVQHFRKIIDSSQKRHLINLNFTGPCKKLSWVLRRVDYRDNNQWDNFTNWPYKNVNPLINQSLNYNPFEGDNTDDINENNHESYQNKSICLNARLLLDGKERFELKNSGFLNLVNDYAHSKNISNDEIYTISFELFSDKKNTQPTGYCNFSNFSDIQLELHLTNKEKNKTYNYEFISFAETYNIFKTTSGMGNLEFSN